MGQLTTLEPDPHPPPEEPHTSVRAGMWPVLRGRLDEVDRWGG